MLKKRFEWDAPQASFAPPIDRLLSEPAHFRFG